MLVNRIAAASAALENAQYFLSCDDGITRMFKTRPLSVFRTSYPRSYEPRGFRRENGVVIMSKPAERVEDALIREGWKTLVRKLGVAKATRFLVAFERGEGHSVKEIKRFWRGKSLDEIYRMVKRAKISP
jgi:hypothetical protein